MRSAKRSCRARRAGAALRISIAEAIRSLISSEPVTRRAEEKQGGQRTRVRCPRRRTRLDQNLTAQGREMSPPSGTRQQPACRLVEQLQPVRSRMGDRTISVEGDAQHVVGHQIGALGHKVGRKRRLAGAAAAEQANRPARQRDDSGMQRLLAAQGKRRAQGEVEQRCLERPLVDIAPPGARDAAPIGRDHRLEDLVVADVDAAVGQHGVSQPVLVANRICRSPVGEEIVTAAPRRAWPGETRSRCNRRTRCSGGRVPRVPLAAADYSLSPDHASVMRAGGGFSLLGARHSCGALCR